MPRDDIEPVSIFEVVESEDDDTQSQHKEELSKFECKAADIVDNKLDESVPRMVADAFEERMHDFLSNILKNILPHVIKDFVKQALQKDLVIVVDIGSTSTKAAPEGEKTSNQKKMTLEENKAQMEEIKRLEFLKAKKEKFKKRLKVLTPENLEAEATKLAAYEAKR
nr:hypothetical protein [Tanacetum cinerariifolium]